MFQQYDRVKYAPSAAADLFGDKTGTVEKAEINDRGIEVVLVAWDDEPWNPQIAAGPLQIINHGTHRQ